MDVGKDICKDIYLVSLPLCTGTASAAVLLAFLPRCSYIAAPACLCLLCAAALPVLLPSRFGTMQRSPLLWTGIFFILGCFCFCNASIVSPGIDTGFSRLSLLHGRLCSQIDALPFSDENTNALLKALLLGDRSQLHRDTIIAFRNAGAAHLLALSGMHLGIIYLIINKILKLAGNSRGASRLRSGATIVLTLLYTLLCGAGPSLVRAWLFILVREGGNMLGRRQDARQVFCVALLLQLCFRSSCIRELGFQLSYLAMVGIVFVWPHVRSWYGAIEESLHGERAGTMVKPGKRLWDVLSLSICCQLFTAPLTWFHFGTFPQYFLLTNLLAAPLTSLMLASGIAALAGSLIFGADSAATTVLAQVCEVPATALQALVKLISNM